MAHILPDSIARNGVPYGATHRAFWGWVAFDAVGCAVMFDAIAADVALGDAMIDNVELEDASVGDVAALSDATVGDASTMSDELAGDVALVDDDATGTVTVEDEVFCG